MLLLLLSLQNVVRKKEVNAEFCDKHFPYREGEGGIDDAPLPPPSPSTESPLQVGRLEGETHQYDLKSNHTLSSIKFVAHDSHCGRFACCHGGSISDGIVCGSFDSRRTYGALVC